MSKLATSLSELEDPTERARRGPSNACGPIYGRGDLDDWQAIEDLRARGFSWREVQVATDEALGVTKPLPQDKFRYHWRRRCFCWSDMDRL